MPSTSSLTPITIGNLPVANRVAFVATVNNLGQNHRVTPEQVAFYEARARGGAGLLITEGMSVHPTSIPNSTIPLAYDPSLVPSLTELTEAVHRHGRPILGQLWHVGRQALWNPSLQPWAPSGERDPYSGTTPHEMSPREIDEVVEGFGAATRNLASAGFDGIEIHGAHGYLITQFLSPWSNRRTDEYGGSTYNRARLLLRILETVRGAGGDDLLVGLKLTAHEYVDGGIDLEETQRIVELLADRQPADYLAVSQANFSPSLEYHVPDLTFGDVPFEHLASGVREVAGNMPVMAIAKIPDLATADRLLDDGAADLVGMSRPWVADAALVAKTARGATPRRCTYCNACWESIHSGRPIACMYAPETGRELEYRTPVPLAEEQRRRVHVIGAGLAGLEFARTAASLGHEVEVHEADDEPGGRIRFESTVPLRREMGHAATWLVEAVREAGARLTTGTYVDEEMVASWDPAAVVVFAGGAEPVVQPMEGARTISLAEAWRSRNELTGPVAIIDEDDDEPVYAIATSLAEQGLEVMLLTRREMIARRVAFVSRIGMHRRLDEAGVRVHVGMVPERVAHGQLIAAHVYSARQRTLGPVTTIVLAGPSRALRPPRTGGRRILVVGDASAPRSYVAVAQEANRVARQFAVPVSEGGGR